MYSEQVINVKKPQQGDAGRFNIIIIIIVY